MHRRVLPANLAKSGEPSDQYSNCKGGEPTSGLLIEMST